MSTLGPSKDVIVSYIAPGHRRQVNTRDVAPPIGDPLTQASDFDNKRAPSSWPGSTRGPSAVPERVEGVKVRSDAANRLNVD